MIIGVPKEIKNNESRVSATPAAVASAVQAGHTVKVEKTPALCQTSLTKNMLTLELK